jgi:plasmid stabilization system protein ParE
MTVTFSEEARRDIFKIGIWTYEQWGEAQVDVYNAHLSALIVAISKNPIAPTSRILNGTSGDIRYRHIRSVSRRGRHVVYYRLQLNGVHILRVLHDKMMATQHVIG